MTSFTAIKKVELTNSTGNPRRYTCASGTGITKNKMLTLSDPRTAAEVSDTPSTSGYVFAGISAMEKDSTDSSTSISAYTSGIFEIRASGAITVGKLVYNAGAGEVASVSDTNMVASGVVVGRALETASDQETINVAVGLVP